MRVALVILHADAARGGAERYTIDLSDSLLKRGHEVSLLATSFAAIPPGVLTVPMRAEGATRLGRYLRFLQSVDTQITRAKYDIVHAMLPIRHCDLYHPHAGIAADAIARGGLISRVGNRWNLRRHRFATIERQLLAGKNPPVVLCLSEQIKATVRRFYPEFPEAQLVTLFNAIDLARFDPAIQPDLREPTRQRFGLGAEDVVGLMLAQDFERKGLRQAILALAEIPDQRVKLLVAGKQNPGIYRNLAASVGVIDRVRFAGPTNHPAAFYRASDFLVLPTRADPCSLVVLEALAMGVPVISTRANGACEIMTDGMEGRVLANPDDIPILSDAIVQVADARRRQNMVRCCQELRTRLAIGNHVDHLEHLYLEICSRNGLPNRQWRVKNHQIDELR